MRRSSRLLPVAAMLTVVGCTGETEPAATTRVPDAPTTNAATSDTTAPAVTLVSLKVPNME